MHSISRKIVSWSGENRGNPHHLKECRINCMMMPRGYYRKRGERGKKSHQDSKQKLLLPIISQQSPAISHCTHVSPINLSLEITRGVLFISPLLSPSLADRPGMHPISEIRNYCPRVKREILSSRKIFHMRENLHLRRKKSIWS